MKSRIITTKAQEEEIEAGKLYFTDDQGPRTVVLATFGQDDVDHGEFIGVVVFSNFYEVGTFADDWDEDKFHPFDGIVELDSRK